MKILLFAPEYRPNLSNMIRTAEFYGFKEIYIYDENGLMNPPNNKVSRADMNHMARVWTAGAIEYIDIKVVDYKNMIASHSGRIIGTAIAQEAKKLGDFVFSHDDLIIMGPEKEGLPKECLVLCDHLISIPHRGTTDCLNVSVSLGIFLHQAISQTVV